VLVADRDRLGAIIAVERDDLGAGPHRDLRRAGDAATRYCDIV
jgi:hypothetical protein